MHPQIIQWNCITTNKMDKANQFFNFSLLKI